MGCSTSKLDNEEAVQLCKDRKKFIKEAVEHRMRFASGHMAYIQSLKRVSAALRDYIEGDDPRAFLLDSYITPPFTTPVKKISNNFISISPKSLSKPPLRSEPRPTVRINYLRSGGNPSVAVQEPVQPPQTVRVETYSPVHQHGTDGFFAMQSSPPTSSSFFSYSPNNRSSFPPPSPQTSQWDFFWNPFSTLDFYGYPTRSSLDQTVLDDDVIGLRQVREEEGIPDLEEETEQEDSVKSFCTAKERDNVDSTFDREEVLVEDADDDDDEDDETDSELDTEHDEEESPSHGGQSIEVSKAQNARHVVSNEKTAVIADGENKEKQGFTVYVQQRPTSMAEVMKDLDAQFMIVCKAASEVSVMLEASKAQYASVPSELTAAKMLNPVALLRSASSRSTSSRFVTNTSSSKDEDYDSCSDLSEESCMFSGSHQTTLDKLYAWEKKLYQEVRAGEKVRIAYDKKCAQLRNQDVKGVDSSSVDKTRVAIRDLHTQMKVSIHSVEAVSKRIETLRDEELQPQLLELVQGLARMWKVMAECHQVQKRTLDEAKLLLAGTPSKQSIMKKHAIMHSDPHQLARSAVNLEMELRNWQSCFRSWITSQQLYIHALSGWVLRCIRCDSDTSKLPFSPRRSSGTPQIFGLCIQWSRYLDGIQVDNVVEGLDFCAAGVGSLYAQQLREESKRTPPVGSKRFEVNMDVVEIGQQFEEEEEAMNAEKMAEVAVKVLCAGMSVAISSLAEFSVGSAQGYADLVKQWENGIRRKSGAGTAT